MRKTLVVFLLAAGCAGWAWAGDLQRVTKVENAGHGFRIDGIQAVKSNPCRVLLQVKCFIDPAVRQPCFIGAYVPSQAAMADFAVRPAGMRNGVPKGELPYGEDTSVELHYLGLAPTTSSSIEVVIYNAAGPLCSKTIAWGRLWTRFAVQNIRPVLVAPDHVTFLLRYFIDPDYPFPCYLSGFVSGPNTASNDFKNKPAGYNPDGVAKGQINFGDNISFELFYEGAQPYKSSSLDVVIYKPGKNLFLTTFKWGQVWKSQIKR